MKFKLKTSELIRSLEITSIVAPPELQKDKKGYLFVVQGDACKVYSRDANRLVRTSIALTEVEGEGAFIYPAEAINAFKFVGDELLFETREEGQDVFVKYESPSGAEGERSTYDPSFMMPCDKDLMAATEGGTFPAPVLREALAGVKDFMCSEDDTKPDHLKTVQLFDSNDPKFAKAASTLYATTSTVAYYFQCTAFEGKTLAISGKHLPYLNNFLGKCEGAIQLRFGKGWNYIIDLSKGGDPDKATVFGWNHQHKTHEKYSYYAMREDKFVFAIPKMQLMNALQHVRTELPPKQDKAKIVFNHDNATIQFEVTEPTSKAKSLPVSVEYKLDDDKQPIKQDRSFSAFININHFISLISDLKGRSVELRVTFSRSADGRREVVMFRTIDEFKLDDAGKAGSEGPYSCRVTRFAPSRE